MKQADDRLRDALRHLPERVEKVSENEARANEAHEIARYLATEGAETFRAISRLEDLADRLRAALSEDAEMCPTCSKQGADERDEHGAWCGDPYHEQFFDADPTEVGTEQPKPTDRPAELGAEGGEVMGEQQKAESSLAAAGGRAPKNVTLRVCPVCGRTDRFGHLSLDGRHSWKGRRCAGVLVTVEYVPAEQSGADKHESI